MDNYSELFDTFLSEKAKADKGNKAAAVRARKASVAIAKAMKEYRIMSLSGE